MALPSPAGWASDDALPLAAGELAPFEVEPSALPAEAARGRARAWRPAVAVLAGLLVLCLASEEAGRRCQAEKLHRLADVGLGNDWEEFDLGPYAGCADEWLCVWDPARVSFWGPAVALPYAALAAWCVWMRVGFLPGVPLHRWTRAFGAGAGVAAALFALRPWSSGCLHELTGRVGPELWHKWVLTVDLLGLKTVTQVLIALKLEELDRPRLARAVRALMAACLLSGSLGPGLLLASVLGCPIVDGSLIYDIVAAAVLFAALCYLLACLCGLSGLLGTAARALCCRGSSQRRAGCFVMLAAVSLALSFASTFLMVFATVQTAILSNRMSAVDALFDCFTVALFSGLVGPAFVRVLAREAFSAINSYTDDQLQAFYEEYLEYLDRAQVKWVRCSYLRHLAAAGAVMPRCQEVPADQVFVGSTGFPLVRSGPKERFVLSHPWLSKEHPDPMGDKLRLLVHQLDMLQASGDHAVFVDYMSLPQNNKLSPELQLMEQERQRMPKPGEHPAVRTEVEEVQFKVALSAMEQIYSIGNTPVIVLPMDSCVETGREYISRGWCLLEFCLSMSFENIANAGAHEPVRRLIRHMKCVKGDTVEGFREAFKSTHFTNKGDSDVVLKLFENTLSLGSGSRESLTRLHVDAKCRCSSRADGVLHQS